jgi:serine/threonine protein kinase
VTDNHWARLEALYHAAAALSPADRVPFLDRECSDDPELHREVESLLEQPSSGGLLRSDAPVMLRLPPIHANIPDRTFIGERIGPYEVISLLGVGGMGEVYRAKDARLGRDVALKVLPAALSTDASRLARFEDEARLLAALNHPNIATIHGIEDAGGHPAIVMELIEGPTMAGVIARGPIPIGEALRIALQIVDALAAAHEHGIVHRDLKPANVKLTSDGRVKVLDFGLARAGVRGNTGLADLPTVTADRTEPGTLLGTVGYMSPEQARGLRVDQRTDIWAFGCVFYETLAGRAAFDDRTPADSIAAILGRDPDWTALPADTPSGVRRLLRRCLERDPARRLLDIGDARADLLEQLGDGPALQEEPESSLYGRTLALFGVGSAYRLWEVLQIRVCFLQYPIIAFLSWKAKSAVPGSPGLLLFFAAPRRVSAFPDKCAEGAPGSAGARSR